MFPFSKVDPTPAAAPVSTGEPAPGVTPVVDPNNPAPAPVAKFDAFTGLPLGEPAHVAPKEGLDSFMDLLQNSGKSEDTPAKGPLTGAEFLSPDNLAKLTEGVDFTKDLSQEVIQGLSENKPEALTAMMNEIAKNAYKTALQHAAMLNDNVITDQLSHQNTNFESIITKNNSEQDLIANMPEIKNPIVQLGLQGITEKLQAANPDWTGAQVATEAKRYLGELFKTFNPEDPTVNQPDADFDFMEFATK